MPVSSASVKALLHKSITCVTAKNLIGRKQRPGGLWEGEGEISGGEVMTPKPRSRYATVKETGHFLAVFVSTFYAQKVKALLQSPNQMILQDFTAFPWYLNSFYKVSSRLGGVQHFFSSL